MKNNNKTKKFRKSNFFSKKKKKINNNSKKKQNYKKKKISKKNTKIIQYGSSTTEGLRQEENAAALEMEKKKRNFQVFLHIYYGFKNNIIYLDEFQKIISNFDMADLYYIISELIRLKDKDLIYFIKLLKDEKSHNYDVLQIENQLKKNITICIRILINDKPFLLAYLEKLFPSEIDIDIDYNNEAVNEMLTDEIKKLEQYGSQINHNNESEKQLQELNKVLRNKPQRQQSPPESNTYGELINESNDKVLQIFLRMYKNKTKEDFNKSIKKDKHKLKIILKKLILKSDPNLIDFLKFLQNKNMKEYGELKEKMNLNIKPGYNCGSLGFVKDKKLCYPLRSNAIPNIAKNMNVEQLEYIDISEPSRLDEFTHKLIEYNLISDYLETLFPLGIGISNNYIVNNNNKTNNYFNNDNAILNQYQDLLNHIQILESRDITNNQLRSFSRFREKLQFQIENEIKNSSHVVICGCSAKKKECKCKIVGIDNSLISFNNETISDIINKQSDKITTIRFDETPSGRLKVLKKNKEELQKLIDFYKEWLKIPFICNSSENIKEIYQKDNTHVCASNCKKTSDTEINCKFDCKETCPYALFDQDWGEEYILRKDINENTSHKKISVGCDNCIKSFIKNITNFLNTQYDIWGSSDSSNLSKTSKTFHMDYKSWLRFTKSKGMQNIPTEMVRYIDYFKTKYSIPEDDLLKEINTNTPYTSKDIETLQNNAIQYILSESFKILGVNVKEDHYIFKISIQNKNKEDIYLAKNKFSSEIVTQSNIFELVCKYFIISDIPLISGFNQEIKNTMKRTLTKDIISQFPKEIKSFIARNINEMDTYIFTLLHSDLDLDSDSDSDIGLQLRNIHDKSSERVEFNNIETLTQFEKDIVRSFIFYNRLEQGGGKESVVFGLNGNKELEDLFKRIPDTIKFFFTQNHTMSLNQFPSSDLYDSFLFPVKLSEVIGTDNLLRNGDGNITTWFFNITENVDEPNFLEYECIINFSIIKQHPTMSYQINNICPAGHILIKIKLPMKPQYLVPDNTVEIIVNLHELRLIEDNKVVTKQVEYKEIIIDGVEMTIPKTINTINTIN